MKKTFVLLALACLLIFDAQSQVFKNEIGISFLNINKSYIRETPTSVRIPFTKIDQQNKGENEILQSANILPELYFSTKIYDDLKFRTSISYDRRTYNPTYGNSTETTSYYQFYLAQGLQLDMFKKRKLIPYLGMDIILHHEWIKGNTSTIDNNWFNEKPITQSTFIDSRLFAGLRYKLANRFSLIFESAATFRVAAFPISRLSINYHF